MAKRKQSEPTTEAWDGDWILPAYRSLQTKIRSSEASSSSLAHEDVPFPLPKQINDYVFEVCKSEGRPSVDIVFFHGLQLEYPGSNDPHITTWMSRNKSELWLKWLVEDEYLRIPNARILTICYDASLRKTDDTGRMDMYVTVENLIHSLTESRAGVGQDECPVVLVGHCFGGLVMKELCVRARALASQPGRLNVENLENLLHSVKGFFTYSSPHHGMRLADRSTWSGKGPLFEDLSTHNEIASRRNEEFRNLRKEKGWKVFGVVESLPVTLEELGFEGIVVEEASARHDVDGFYTVPDANHFDVCRPKSTTCSSFELLRKFVSDVVEKDKAGVSTNLLTNDQFNPIVDIDSRVEVVMKKLKRNQRLGIAGFGGMGKTTLAKAVVDRISGRFEYVCFFEDVKSNMAEDEVLDHLRAQILKRLQWKGHTVDESFNWDKLKRKKVLICLDDAKYESQVRVMLQSDDFSEDSRVIVTSRQGDFLRNQGFEIHDATGLDLRNSERLFCLHAFGQLEVPQTYKQRMLSFVRSFAKKCAGHPLALKVSGGYLSMYKGDGKLWGDALKKLNNAQSLSGDCKDKLWSIVTVETLAPIELKMFLDAATCFHYKQLKDVQKAWAACYEGGWRSGWKNLLDRCLVSIDVQTKRIMMHDLLRELGRKEAGHNRVCNVSDIMQLREEDKATVKVLQLLIPLNFYRGEIPPSAIWKLGALEYLEIMGSIVYPHDEQFEALRHLENTFCNLEVVPKSVGKHGAIRCLRILECLLTKLPEAVGQLQALRYLEIWDCKNLKALPNSIGNLQALERLEIRRCHALNALPESIGNLRALQRLEIKQCNALNALSDSIGNLRALERLEIGTCDVLNALPDSIGNLWALERLEIGTCDALDALPDSIGNLRALECLEIKFCDALDALPDSIGNLCALERLEIGECDALNALPDSIGNLHALERLEIGECEALNALPDSIGNLCALERLEIGECVALNALPDSIGNLRALERLEIGECEALNALPDSIGNLRALECLEIRFCDELNALPNNIGNLRALKRLEIDHCWQIEALPDSIGNLRALEHLEIRGCEYLKALPNSIGNLQDLKHLEITGCHSLRELPKSFDKLIALEHLELKSWPHYREPLVHNIGNFQNLTYLAIGCDSLRAFPEGARELRKLETLIISLHFKEVPEFVCQLEGLQHLSLENNGYYGMEHSISFPDTLGHLHKLEKLIIRHIGDLEFVDPEFVGQLTALQHLEFYGCDDLEKIPEFIAQLPNLRHLKFFACDRLETPSSSFLEKLHALQQLTIHRCELIRKAPEWATQHAVRVDFEGWAE